MLFTSRLLKIASASNEKKSGHFQLASGHWWSQGWEPWCSYRLPSSIPEQGAKISLQDRSLLSLQDHDPMIFSFVAGKGII